jgi:hypothetical protein
MNRHKQREYTFRVVFSIDQNKTTIPLEDLDLHIDSVGITETEDKELLKDKVTQVFNELCTLICSLKTHLIDGL